MTHRFAACLVFAVLAFPPQGLCAQDAVASDMGANVPVTDVKGEPSINAKLIDADKKAQQGSATVSVEVKGVALVDPGAVQEKPAKGQGHLHYRVDDGPVIATPANKLSFHGLTPGAHTITVILAGNDHSPLGPTATLNVTVPNP